MVIDAEDVRSIVGHDHVREECSDAGPWQQKRVGRGEWRAIEPQGEQHDEGKSKRRRHPLTDDSESMYAAGPENDSLSVLLGFADCLPFLSPVHIHGCFRPSSQSQRSVVRPTPTQVFTYIHIYIHTLDTATALGRTRVKQQHPTSNAQFSIISTFIRPHSSLCRHCPVSTSDLDGHRMARTANSATYPPVSSLSTPEIPPWACTVSARPCIHLSLKAFSPNVDCDCASGR